MHRTGPHFTDSALTFRPSQSIDPAQEDSDSFRLDKTDPGPMLIPHTFSHYELLEIMGEGQFGTVWRAKDQRLDRVVALKLPHLADWDEQARTMFLREARAAATLEHPHIVRVHEIEQVGDQPGIVSQFIVGQTLFQRLCDSRLTFSESAQMLVTIAEAVHYAHESGVIHRDLKPSNILVDLDGQPHVSDFGLAKWSGDPHTLTNPGLVLGTPAYMSPEQARGDSHAVDCRSDVYSLGVLLYEMLTGKPPFEGNSALLLHRIQSQVPDKPRSRNKAIPSDLDTICLKCLAKSPDDRYGTAQELADDLRRFLAGEPITARSVGVAERCVSWTRRNPTLAASLAVAAVSTVAAVGLAFSFFTFSRPEPLAAAPIERSLAVSVLTEPPGATIAIYPLDKHTGEPIFANAERPSQKSPVSLQLFPGDYLVVAALDDGRFHEVYRHVPGNSSGFPDYYPHRTWERISHEAISWFPIKIPPSELSGMTLLADGDDAQSLAPYFLDQQEVTVSDFLRRFRDQLPASLRGRAKLLQTPDFPLTGLFFDEAVMFAEAAGKRLPAPKEYEFAATNGWTTRFPWGDSPPPGDSWNLDRVGHKVFDQTRSDPPIFGLFSNASEFVFAHLSPNVARPSGGTVLADRHPMNVVVRGGPIDAANEFQKDPRWQMAIGRMSLLRQVGFRCAKSKSPRL